MQTAVDGKYLGTKCICTEYIQILFMSLFLKRTQHKIYLFSSENNPKFTPCSMSKYLSLMHMKEADLVYLWDDIQGII
jgi:cytidine deaminase